LSKRGSSPIVESYFHPLPPFRNKPAIWRGLPKRLGKKYAGDHDWDRRHRQWLMSLKPGDVINNCTLFNHVICKIEVWWDRPAGLRRGHVLAWVELTTAGSGGCSGFHCGVLPALDQDQLLAQCRSYDWVDDGWLHELVRRMERGDRVLDEHRLLVPSAGDPENIHHAYEANVNALKEFGKRR
jgi:hypothetical protein